MSDEQPDPMPVLPLDYAGGQSEAQRKVLKLMAWMFVIWQISSVVHLAADAACYFWEQDTASTLRKMFKPIPLIIALPGGIISLYLIANSPAMLSLSVKGRQWIRGGAIAKGVVGALTSVGYAINALVDRNVFRYGTAYGVDTMLEHLLAIVFTIIEYAIFYRLFAENGD
jgi:hypothetical protein